MITWRGKNNNNLDLIKSPDDIKQMTEKELVELAKETRDFLLENVSKTGGHLASNLGAVELTLALHHVFDSPNDKIIWDVGHQSYVHKMITGRMDGFSNLRKTGGMSGFPKRVESEHDIYDTGHSSTSIAAALGIATARDLKGEDYEVIAVIGDGSMTGGPAFEALNNVGNANTKIIILLNDNGMSISRNIGGLSEHLGKLRTSTGYQQAKETIKDKLDQVPVLGSGLKSVLGSTKDNLKYMLLSGGVLFEELGLTYLGPIDGHNIKDVINALRQAKNLDGPVIVHAITKKGKGYKHAEFDPNRFHGIGSFDIESGETISKQELTYSEVFGDALYEVAKYNPRITAITAAMCDATGLNKMQEEFPERVFDVGIAEAYGVIFAAGQAINGMHPYVAIYSSFLQRAYDEIMEDVCLQKLPVTFAIDRAGIVGADGETHHGIFDFSYLIPMPGMTVYSPCDAVQLRKMIELSSKETGPVAIRYPRGNAEIKNLTKVQYEGKNIRLYSGTDVDILAVGPMLNQAIKARKLLKDEGIDAGVVNISLVKNGQEEKPKPGTYLIDEKHIHPLIVTLEDNVKPGGFGDFFNSMMVDNNLIDGNRILNIAWPDKFIEQGSTDDLYKAYGLDAEGIKNSIVKELNLVYGEDVTETKHERVRDSHEKEERMQILHTIFHEEHDDSLKERNKEKKDKKKRVTIGNKKEQ